MKFYFAKVTAFKSSTGIKITVFSTIITYSAAGCEWGIIKFLILKEFKNNRDGKDYKH